MSLEIREKSIISFFDKEGKSMAKKDDVKGIPDSAKIQVNDIIASGASKAIDVGSGPGSILIELLEGGMENVVGIDLSPEMNEIAKSRIADKNFTDKTSLYSGSFLNYELEDDIDAVSLHRVLCCHPDREGMLEKAMTCVPKIITLTVPRDWKLMKLYMALFGLVAGKFNLFQPFAHSQKKIDQQLFDKGYKLINKKKGLMWVSSTYSIKKTYEDKE
jgi:SAM-dependent methyltransferase